MGVLEYQFNFNQFSISYNVYNSSNNRTYRFTPVSLKYKLFQFDLFAGRKLITLPKRLEWNEAFKAYISKLNKKKPVIICGDMNVSHNEIDLARPKSNTKNAGFTEEERDGMTDFLGEGYVDTFRHLYPDKTDMYTFWTYMGNARSKNIGW